MTETQQIQALREILRRAGKLAMHAENILHADVMTITVQAMALEQALNEYNNAVMQYHETQHQ